VDKYLFMMMILLAGGMVFSVVKGLNDPNNLLLFYAQLAGALIIIAYSTAKNRKRKTGKKRDT
jgi:hypothetical protein